MSSCALAVATIRIPWADQKRFRLDFEPGKIAHPVFPWMYAQRMTYIERVVLFTGDWAELTLEYEPMAKKVI